MTRSAEPGEATPVVDTRGLCCPWPALRAARAMRDMARFVLIADDPKAEAELAALAAVHGWTAATRRLESATETLLEAPRSSAGD